MSIFSSIPIIQAPMLGASSFAMAREASLAGAMGSLALAGTAPEAIGGEVERLRDNLGDRPFGANLFLLNPVETDARAIEAAMAALAPYRAELGLPAQAIPNKWAENSGAQVEALIDAAPPVASFTFGILTRDQVERFHARGSAVFGTATTVAEARAWAEIGADAIIAQGMEAGGHRGTFMKPVGESLIGTIALVPAIKAATGLPTIAAGGVMDGRSIAAMLLLGADAVQMGTAFLLAEESAISPPWRAELRNRTADDVALTRAFSGRHARGIRNRFMQDMEARDIPLYPIQNALTAEMRAAAAKAGRSDLLSLWAGQGVHAIQEGRTGEMVNAFWAAAREALDNTRTRFN